MCYTFNHPLTSVNIFGPNFALFTVRCFNFLAAYAALHSGLVDEGRKVTSRGAYDILSFTFPTQDFLETPERENIGYLKFAWFHINVCQS